MADPTFQQASSPAPQYYRYNKGLLAAFAAVWTISMILMFSDPSIRASATAAAHTASSSFGVSGSIGVVLLLCVIVPVLALDWRGFTTLHGVIKWGRMKGWQKFVVGYFFIGLSMFLLPVYFIQAYGRIRQDAELRRAQQKHHVAELEASLGIMPATEGTCRNCHKPMQVGADFCAYCGTTAVEKPKVCPVCATVALPDAHFCPKCRTPLAPATN